MVEPVAPVSRQRTIRLVPSGPTTDGLSSLLYSPRLTEFLQRVAKEFDLVLIDAPPMLHFADARVLGRHSDGVILVVTGRHPRFLLEDREHLIALGANSKKPVLLWSYTRPAAVCVDLLSEAGLPLFTNVHNCARAMRVMADYRVARAKVLKG